MRPPDSLGREISPPPTRKRPTIAAVETGRAHVQDHLDYFSKHLQTRSRPSSGPRLGIDAFRSLYARNQHLKGRHFVIHQHDHPISGVHYDLRLQFSESSTVSFAIPYGLPVNANSVRPHRMAIETRVHNLWNNLIESASHASGSLLIWDTGEYEIMPQHERDRQMTDDDGDDDLDPQLDRVSDSERLFAAFQSRRIRLRLHGSKLPAGYTMRMWLPSANDRSGPSRNPRLKRRRIDPTKFSEALKSRSADTESDRDEDDTDDITTNTSATDDYAAIASDTDEDAAVRSNNAYTGASNSIGSVHQRHWFLSLDRRRSGFRKERTGPDRGQWVGGWDPIFVRGIDFERSLITGRMADDVMADEGVEKFIGRKMWRPILE
ncbi:Hypothetical protein R9X50_00779200 [Acrodontium crateriforme]|uniref:DNA ligase D 3'-phosphoesterase domain-containing protein n=1 Tax=Acrodontium crateriforme TaxID=150365 RepID=A0AAQ3MBW3_9PEZI|nr:Hypothetical protein R9X50_00779200 [Acrodontium crateriforme]